MKFVFGAITVVCFLGSLSLVFPNVFWRDITYFFRNNKDEYLRFSNLFIGKCYFILGCCSLVFLILSFFIEFRLNKIFVLFIFFICLGIGRVWLEVAWKKHVRQNII